MTKAEQALALRDDPARHYNCAQAVLLPFALDAALTEDQALAISAHFGGGMRMGSVCGAVTGGLMALGLLGHGEPTAAEFRRRFKAEVQHMDCADLLRAAKENGEEKAPHCNRMVALAAALVEELTAP